MSLKNHILFCMKNFTTYIMWSNFEQDYDARTTADECSVVGVAIVEKPIVMIKCEERSLTHYLVVSPEYCLINIGTATLKMIMSQSEYENKKIMAVTSLPRSYGGVLAGECYDSFFKNFNFLDSVKIKKKKGENDVNALASDGSGVSWADCIQIRNASCSYQYYKTDFGYYELDNHSKYSICQNPHNDCIYAKNAHFGWDKLDQDGLKDFPANRLTLARDNVGRDIMLTASGHREEKYSTSNTFKTMEGNIPSQYRQATYDKANGCVWLSACLLIHSVDSKFATAMIERYAHDQEYFEWLDIFNRKKGQGNNQYRWFNPICATNSVFEKRINTTSVKLSWNTVTRVKNTILSDENGIRSHAVGIDVGKQLIYDYMEENVMVLNKENLSTCCGVNGVFDQIAIAGKLKEKMQKK